ncbi:carotenoid 1,2-hydratase [Acetobacteraceae bacterium KSS8]|uniref:Carotenoid 1,2-hydratase n=1 Tax=Endosaccharibacter trunci TaxID=2812733 RepID=A0ABT1W506_9PROT|nr:carotenoid 1,2-hydratase [Acetobacteraceae bacterium KSS8]
MRFDQPVAPNGYRWWYVDALSDDGCYGITVIAFLGSVFSPFYAWSRRKGATDPLDHSALHVALYRTDGGRAPRRWCMTERGARAVERHASVLRIGPSALHWRQDALEIRIDERTMPWGERLRGTVTVHPQAFTGFEAILSETGDHRWTPFSPRARVSVDLSAPALRWSGDGYLDGNHGAGAIEDAFRSWHWCRAPRGDGAFILYDAERREGGWTGLALRIGRDGTVLAIDPPPETTLAPSRWGVSRQTRSEDGWARARRSFVDAPFYARALIETRLGGERGPSVHESLDCDRFRALAVQAMLPFRVARRAG